MAPAASVSYDGAMTHPESVGEGPERAAASQLNNLEQLLPKAPELEPHEAELGFVVVEAHEGRFGQTIILGREIDLDESVLTFRPQDHPELGFVGGAARAGLELALGEQPEPPRDIDVIRLADGASIPDAWSLTYDGWTDLAGYMNRRDLTVNEVLMR